MRRRRMRTVFPCLRGRAGIHARRYFYPLISDMPMYRGLASAVPDNLPKSREIASQILCLPIYPALVEQDQNQVIEILRRGD